MLTRRELQDIVAEVLGEEAAAGDNLIELGLDSIRLMGLTGRLRKRGIEIGFAELAERPSLAEWWDLLAGRGALEPAPAASPSVSAEPADGPFPLALMQHAYWIGRDDGQALGSVAAHLYVELDGRAVDPDRFTRAVADLVARHPMLRVAVGADGLQRILPARPGPPVTVRDLREVADPDKELAAIRDEMSVQRLAIEQGLVFDARLSLLPSGLARVHLDVDMVAADAMSYRTLLADLAALYSGAVLAPIGYDYRTYLSSTPRAAARERDRHWWAERLADLPGPPELPVLPRPGGRVTRLHHWLDAAGRARFVARAHERGVTPAMALAAVFAEVIGAWSATPRFALNLPLFHREPVHPEVNSVVGDFTGSVLLSVDLTENLPDRPFADRARAVQASLHTAGAHSDYSGLEVLRDLSRARGEQVLAPVVHTSALNLGELFGDQVTEAFGEPGWIISQGPQVLLDAQVTEVSGGLLLNWDVRDPAFPEGVADAMFNAYRTAITRLSAEDAEDADWSGPLHPAGPSRRTEISPPPPARTLHEAFFIHAARTPQAPALHYGTHTLTYGELAARALSVAAHLKNHDVRPGDRVAVELPKGPDQAAAVLGVLATGAAYVPIGLAQPPARRARIHRAAQVKAVLSQPVTTGPAIDPATDLASLDPDRAAYVLFTSGSTGEPKGVEVSHRAAMNTIGDLVERFELGPSDVSLGVSALDFDLSVFDMFALWSAGGAVVLPEEDERRDAARWAELAAAWSVTVLNCVPSVLEMLLAVAGPLPSLRLVLLGGDWVGTHLPALLAESAPGARFVALGGTTETAIHSTVQEVTGPVPADWTAVPYGVPLRGVACRVVDELGRDRPDWAAGELWIGGDGVAEGYVGDPERTADRFVRHDGLRWYRTGDLARYRPDGTLEFLGRRDHQVKLRGFRIELGEIEAALRAHPAVDRAAALVTGTRLAAVVAGSVTVDELVAHVAGLLPPHMVPGLILPAEELPLTANGKVDRKALTALVATAAGESAYVPPATDLERVLAGIVGEVLKTERVGAEDDFFALGGDSVLATTVMARLREALDTGGLAVRVVFAERTVAGIARRLAELEETPGRLETVAGIYLAVERLSEDELTARLGA